jgi:hypothetical protein
MLTGSKGGGGIIWILLSVGVIVVAVVKNCAGCPRGYARRLLLDGCPETPSAPASQAGPFFVARSNRVRNGPRHCTGGLAAASSERGSDDTIVIGAPHNNNLYLQFRFALGERIERRQFYASNIAELILRDVGGHFSVSP